MAISITMRLLRTLKQMDEGDGTVLDIALLGAIEHQLKDHSQVEPIADHMVRAGYLERVPYHVDTRDSPLKRYAFRMTEAGKELLRSR